MNLLAELGADSGPPPEWDEFFRRLHFIRPNWPWIEQPQADGLSGSPALSVAQDVGLYNRAILFGKEQSPYTVGLERELTKLQAMAEAQYAGTALSAWINAIGASLTPTAPSLLEVLPLNSEQREAVRRGLTSPLTVVTGPPGTGKSQVVTSLLLNAAWTGKKVLFASKNNKAVDVVETRVNALGPRPILLRLGADKVRAELAEYLLRLLSAVTTGEDKAQYKEHLRLHADLLAKIASVEAAATKVIELRNKVDGLERSVESWRSKFSAPIFEALRSVSPVGLASAIAEVNDAVNRCDRSAQPFITRLTWTFHQAERWRTLNKVSTKHRRVFEETGLVVPTIEAGHSAVGPWGRFMTLARERLAAVKAVQQYFDALRQLNEAGDLSRYHAELLKLTEESTSLCQSLWSCWLALQPEKLTPTDRKLLGDYASVLQLIVAANESGTTLGKEVFRRYYELFPKIAGQLPCWAVTSLSANGRIPLEPGFFDLVVIDEASQCDIASALPLLFRAKAAVIIGDPRQLRHISSLSPQRDRDLLAKHSLVDDFAGWAYSVTSLFDLASRLCPGESITALRDHHRCHADIIEFSNRTFYEGRLRVATKHDRLRPATPGETGIRWITVEGESTPAPTGGAVNRAEAARVVQELRRLAIEQRYAGTIGVVTPFRAQANLIRELVARDNDLGSALARAEFLAETAHRFQGDERDIIIFSPVVSPGLPGGSAGFLAKTPNLFNVAITRARSCLVVVGSASALAASGINHMAAFAKYCASLKRNGGSAWEASVPDAGGGYPSVARPELVSEWEHVFYRRLYAAGVRPIPQFAVENYLLDFAIIENDRRLNVEIDGERYHRDWDGELLLRDRLRNQRLIELGWDVRRFWVYQVRDNPEDCVRHVLEWMNASGRN